jgi:hypothetical protein
VIRLLGSLGAGQVVLLCFRDVVREVRQGCCGDDTQTLSICCLCRRYYCLAKLYTEAAACELTGCWVMQAVFNHNCTCGRLLWLCCACAVTQACFMLLGKEGWSYAANNCSLRAQSVHCIAQGEVVCALLALQPPWSGVAATWAIPCVMYFSP